MTTRIARIAIAVMALHVIDDSFLQPAPGTTFADHLVSGLAPLAALAAAAWAFRRLRAGGRAATALLLGPLGVALGAEAVHYWRAVGLSGDDYTGMLAIPAGVTLLGVAGTTLWTSRRLDDSRYWRYPRRLLLGAAGLLGFAWVIFPLSLSYGVTHITRAEVHTAKLGTAHETVTLHTRDGLDLAGWYIPSRNGAAVIVYPGRGTAQKHAHYLSRRGYGVLLFDRRGEGASEGDPHGFGWTFDKDIQAAVAFLKTRTDVDHGRIGGLGLSVGGEMMLQTAAGTKDLAGVVSDGAGARVATAPPSDLTDYIPRIAPRPFMLIHAAEGEVDNKTPEYLAAARGPAEHWEVPKGGHTAGIRTMPKEYARTVLDFFDRSLRDRADGAAATHGSNSRLAQVCSPLGAAPCATSDRPCSRSCDGRPGRAPRARSASR